jgi:hypothetical protein
MEKEFIPYKQALALKELGFDEPCLAFFWNTGKFYTTAEYPHSIETHKQNQLGDYNYDSISAPLYQQVFRWFGGRYDLDSHIYLHETHNGSKNDIYYEEKYYRYYITKSFRSPFILESENYKTSEEAELACLKKLIEIIKNK